jgi:hypothetical protein
LSTARNAAILKRTISTRLIFFLYQLLQIAFSPALALYLLYRCLRDRRYFHGLAERFGFLSFSLRGHSFRSLGRAAEAFGFTPYRWAKFFRPWN